MIGPRPLRRLRAAQRARDSHAALQQKLAESDAALDTIIDCITRDGRSAPPSLNELERTITQLHTDAERWRALMQHVGPLHDQLHAIEQAVSSAHRALHELTGQPGGPR